MIGRRIALVLTLLAMAASAHAQAQRGQFEQMVDQLRKTPGDDALRGRIIKLGVTSKPAPAIPEEAVKFEGRAQFAFGSAKSGEDYLVAAREYERAVAIAPWVPGYYSDLCTIYEKAGKFEDAKRNCELYLIGLGDPGQITDVKRRIAGLEFGIEKAAGENARYGWLTGRWGVAMTAWDGTPLGDPFPVSGTRGGDSVVFATGSGFNVLRATVRGDKVSWEFWRQPYENRPAHCPLGPGWEAMTPEVSPDRRRLTFSVLSANTNDCERSGHTRYELTKSSG